MSTEEQLGKTAYEAFRRECHGYTREWDQLRPPIRQTWIRVAAAVLAENNRHP